MFDMFCSQAELPKDVIDYEVILKVNLNYFGEPLNIATL